MTGNLSTDILVVYLPAVLAILMGIIGLLRGTRREVLVSAAIVLASLITLVWGAPWATDIHDMFTNFSAVDIRNALVYVVMGLTVLVVGYLLGSALVPHTPISAWSRIGGLVSNLEKETRRAVLADLRPTDRYHPDRVERLTYDGHLSDTHRLAFTEPLDDEDLDLEDLLMWAVKVGMREDDLRLLVESEQRRGAFQAAAAHSLGISERQIRRRRERTLRALRDLAPVYLAAVA